MPALKQDIENEAKRLRCLAQLERVLDGPLFKHPYNKAVITNDENLTILTVADLRNVLIHTRNKLKTINNKELAILFKSGLRIKKHHPHGSYINSSPRTQVLPANMQDNLKIKILTNTKLTDQKYDKHGILGCGSYKVFKACLDVEFEDHKDLPIIFSPGARGSVILCHMLKKQECKHALMNLKKEVEISHRYSSNAVARLDLGPVFTKKNTSFGRFMWMFSSILAQKVAYVFSEKSIGTLATLRRNFSEQEKLALEHDVKNGRIPLLYIKLFADILKAFIEIHAHGDVHNDIKPDNILIYKNANNELFAKITDFGLTILNEDANKIHLPSTTDFSAPEKIAATEANSEKHSVTILGLGQSVYYKNPERYKNITPPDSKIDMWAFGITMFEFLTGYLPYYCAYHPAQRHAEITEVLTKHPFIQELLSEMPEDRPTAKQALERLNTVYKTADQDDNADLRTTAILRI